MAYQVKIESFEGPFQLLLALVSEQKVDIGSVSVTEVADQYLAYLDTMHDLDMDVASDFLVVASTLLAIKASALLPADEEEQDYDEEFDSLTPSEARDILITRLIAYKQIKNAAASLGARFDAEARMHARQAGIELPFVGLLPDYLEGITLHNLAVLCAGHLMRRTTFILDAAHIIAKPVPLEECIDAICARLTQRKDLTFKELLDDSSDPVVVVRNFIALLELYHRGIIDLEQSEYVSEINIHYLDEDQRAPAPQIVEPQDPVIDYLESKEEREALSQ